MISDPLRRHLPTLFGSIIGCWITRGWIIIRHLELFIFRDRLSLCENSTTAHAQGPT